MPEHVAPFAGEGLLASEIAQQPTLWATTLELVRLAAIPEDMIDGQVVLTGAGTSAYAAAAIAEAWPGARAIPTTDLLLQSADEIEAGVPILRQGGVLISLARSGDSPESVAVVERLQRLFPLVKHIAIVCNAAGRLAHTPGVLVITLDPRTNDRSLAMTSSFTNLVLGGLCLRHASEIAAQLPSICSGVESRLPELSSIAKEIAGTAGDRVVVLTSGMQALAKEVALKIIELSAGRIMSMSETFLGFRHGPVGFLRDDTPVICFLSSDPHKRLYENDLLEDLRGRKLGRLVVVGEQTIPQRQLDWNIPALAPGLPDTLRTPFEMFFAQLLAYHLSVHAGMDPDNPSPNGAITRVVRPFRIHDGAGAEPPAKART